MPTPEQLASREKLKQFVETVSAPLRDKIRNIKSEWFGRPDEELQGFIDRGRAINEIKDSLGYKLIMAQTDKEIEWARAQLELGTFDAVEIRMYLRSLRFLKDFILTIERNADVSSSVLAGRSGELAREATAFVKNARVGEDR